MPNGTDDKEKFRILGEVAASRLHDLIQYRFEEIQARQSITQSDLARKIGITEQQLSRWMVAPRNMTVKSAGRLLGALDAYLEFTLDPFEEILRSANAARQAAAVPVTTSSTKIITNGQAPRTETARVVMPPLITASQ